ncbi:MAG TPA: CAP domain-containing protein [Pyrinomonadaceae bacterium]|nr:CAP domain-containing protein [Pyrinomonadaceae bacterium]
MILASALALLSVAAHANGRDNTPKSAPRPAEPTRPVARLISSSSYGNPARARVVSRVSTPSASYSSAPSPSAVTVAASGDERRAFELINSERRRRGLRPLVMDGSLTRLARYHSESMARGDYLSHTDRQGLDLRGRADALGLHNWKAIAENIAYNQGYKDPTAFAVERWMVSEKHRENIMNDEYTHAGVGVVRASDGTYYFTQVFMRR